MFCVWALLSHDRYQYDSLILYKQTWAISLSTLVNSCCDASVMSSALTWCWRHEIMPGKKNHHSSTLLRKLCVHYANDITFKVSISFIVTLYTFYCVIVPSISLHLCQDQECLELYLHTPHTRLHPFTETTLLFPIIGHYVMEAVWFIDEQTDE
jgi:hypothetical protein